MPEGEPVNMLARILVVFALGMLITSCRGGSTTEKVHIQSQLPPDVVEFLYLNYYENKETCLRPPLNRLSVLESWTGLDSQVIQFTRPKASPIDDTDYFLVVDGVPLGPRWHFESILEAGTGSPFNSQPPLTVGHHSS